MFDNSFLSFPRKNNSIFSRLALPFILVALLLLTTIPALISYQKGKALYLTMSIRTSASGEAALYYDLGSGIRDADKAVTQIRKDPSAVVYTFALPNRDLFRFRFDPPAMFGGEISVDHVRILNAQGKILREIDINRMRPLQQIKTFQHTGSEVILTIQDEAADPQVGIDLDSPFRPAWFILKDVFPLGLLAGEILVIILIYFMILYLLPRLRVHPNRRTILITFLCSYAGGLLILSEKATTSYLKVTMQSSSSGIAQLYFDNGTGYSEASSVRMNITGGKDFSDYLFRLPDNNIFQFRFDPLSSAGRFVIRQMEVVNGMGISIQSFALHQVQPEHQIHEYKFSDQDLRIVTEEQANDPQLIINLQQPFDVSKIDLLLNPLFIVCTLLLFPAVLLSMAVIVWGWRKGNVEWFFYLPLDRHKYILFTACVIISLVILSGFHHQGFSNALRYTRVAEGNISRVVHHMWSSGPSVLADTIRGDAQTWGRIRPAQWLFYNIPFALTLARNGDLFRDDAMVPISQRINGDLQTHTLFLILCMAVACGSCAWLIWRLSHSWVAVVLFPLYVSLGFPLCENLLVNYCDSQEIPQLLWISLYLVGIYKTFEGQKTKIPIEIIASGFLLLAYSAKETSLILFPLFSIVFGYLLFSSAKEERAFRRFCRRQWLLHAIFSTILIAFVWAFRSGAYVTKNYIYDWQHLSPSVLYSLQIFQSGVPWLHLAVLGFVPLAVLFIHHMIRKQFVLNRSSSIILILIIALGLTFGFWLIILPWEQRLAKYYLPSIFWGSLVAVIIQIFLMDQLRKHGYPATCAIWLLVSCLYLLWDINRLNDNIQNFYRQEYGYRRSVPIISKDIAASLLKTGNNDTYRVHILVRPLFQEGALPFQRQVNLLYGINIAVKGQQVRHVAASEQNYFRNYSRQSAVEISLGQSLSNHSEKDIIYVLQFSEVKEWSGINLEGFHISDQWDDAHQIMRIVKYDRI